ncbi:MAG TPA: hypothetical protein IGS53_12290 [Leptolyngbyaceae cyanobacterium M33_DOE_097]|nr:hypothetical protein [Leptolyngbyaceae cyanobacterium M33_DOE_097]
MTRLLLLPLILFASLLTQLESASALDDGAVSFEVPAVTPASAEPPAAPVAIPAAIAEPVPPLVAQEPAAEAPAPVEPAPAVQEPVPEAPAPAPQASAPAPVTSNQPVDIPTAPAPAAPGVRRLDTLFKGGSQSVVARTVGHAEGTRTAAGGYTRAYRGHVDPGNGVWNLGTFSFQHCREAKYRCSTAEQADRHQLRRLQRQARQLRQRAAALGMEMTLEEELNAIDLVNQSPRAALARKEAYPEHLARARRMGLRGKRAILEGRVWAYWDGERKRWAAPGLGNTERGIRRDQRRRMLAIAAALEQVERQRGAIAPRERVVDQILAQ